MNAREWEQFIDRAIKRCQEMESQIRKERKIWEAIRKQISDADKRPFPLLSLLEQLRGLQSEAVQELEQLETALNEKAAEQINNYGDLLRQALAPDGYEVEGRFPNYRVRYVIEVHIDEQRRQARIRTPSYTAPPVRDISVITVADAVRKEAQRLFGRAWEAGEFLRTLYHAYLLGLTEEGKHQRIGEPVRIWSVHRFVVWIRQKEATFKDVSGKTFQPYPPDEFAVDIGRLLGEEITYQDYRLHLTPVRDPQEALFIVNFKTGVGQNYGFLSFQPK